jgi:hypothetical protein
MTDAVEVVRSARSVPRNTAPVPRSRRTRAALTSATVVVLVTISATVAIGAHGHAGEISPQAGSSGQPTDTSRFIEGSWSELPSHPLLGAEGALTTWTGRELVVVGSAGGHLQEASFSPGSRRWKDFDESPLPALAPATVEGTGSEVLVWGARFQPANWWPAAMDGALLDPVRGDWRRSRSSRCVPAVIR